MKTLINWFLVIQTNLVFSQSILFKSDGVYYEDSINTIIANGKYSFVDLKQYHDLDAKVSSSDSVVFILDSGKLVSMESFHIEDKYQRFKLVYENNEIKDSVYTFLNKKYILSGFYVQSIEKVSFIDGKRNGLSIRMVKEDSILWVRSICSYLNGNPHGLYLVLKKNGNPYKEITFKYGIKDGYERKYYEDLPQIEYEFLYLSGKANGISRQWWKNGNLKSKAYYENGIIEGTITLFLKGGGKAVEQMVENGKAIQTKLFVKDVRYFERNGYLLEEKDSTHELIESW